MKNRYSSRIWQTITGAFMLLLIAAEWSAVHAQACGDPGGGAEGISLTSPFARHYYPGAVPSGKTGQGRATVGHVETSNTMNAVYAKKVTTIHPELPGFAGTGYVTLKFVSLVMAGSSAVIKIYEGIDETGTLVKTINAANAPSLVLTSESHIGPVTITFQSPTAVSGSFDIDIVYMTGNQLIPATSEGYKAAIWTEFQQPDSYTLIDGFGDSLSSSFTPASIAYIDANRQFVSSETAYCLDHDRHAVQFNTHYPGEVTYTRVLVTDIDRSGSFDAVDRLRMARITYIMAHAPTGNTRDEMKAGEAAVWTTMSTTYQAGYPGLHSDAIAAIPSLPDPAEPVFSLTGPAGPVLPNNPAVFTLNFALPAGYNPSVFTNPQQVKLVVPAGITISGVSGDATYSGGVLTFTSLPATVLISAVSSVPRKATLQVIYEKAGLWNVYNFKAYRPCNADTEDLQDFVGRSQGDVTYPNRDAVAAWEGSLPVRLVSFNAQAEGSIAFLNWTTASEEGNKGFEILRSPDTKTWQTLGFVNAKTADGNSSVEQNYRYSDLTPLAGTSYYRLKMVDLDGAFMYSQIRSLQTVTVRNLLVYPNPVVNGKLSVVVSGLEPEAVEIYNAAGAQKVRQKLENGHEVNVKGLAPGMYILRVVSAGKETQTTTFLVK